MFNLFLNPALDLVTGHLGQMMQNARGFTGHQLAEVSRSSGIPEETIQFAAQAGHLVTEGLGSLGDQLNKNRSLLLGPVLNPPLIQVFRA